MNPLIRRQSAVVAACLVGLALAAPAFAADDKAPSDKAGDRVLVDKALYDAGARDKPADSKALDRYLHNSLRFVINHGVDLYNANRVEQCYDHFRTSLQELEPVLDKHPDLQKMIKESLDKVEKDPEWRLKMAAKATMPNPQDAPVVRQKAFALRAVFNEVRAGLNPDGSKPPPPTGDEGTVDGRIQLDDKPLAKGKVTLTSAAGKSFSADIAADGSYKLTKVPAGEYKVAVTGTGVPAKYGDPKTSGLTVTVRKGGNLADFPLKGETTEPAADTGNVEGKVSLDGKPVAKGKITFTGKDGKAHGENIDDGFYAIEKLPVGTYTVTVTGGGVPAKYGDPKTSGLTQDVKKGPNKGDIDLKGDKKPEENPKPEEVGSITGKVTYKGVPLPAGTITFHPLEGKAGSAPIREDGTYSADKVPVGDAAVTVDTQPLKPADKPKGDKPKGDAPKFVKIPAKYADKEKSDLKVTIKKGKNVYDIELKD
jgi:hypothetical protein